MAIKIKIAFADDSILQRALIRNIIDHKKRFQLLFVCSNGKELVDQLEACSELPQVCLIDLHMPLMNGIETANRIREKFPSIKVFGYTSSIKDSEIEVFYKSGVKMIFNKSNINITLQQIHRFLTANT
ncbi:response regulator [Sphingobacterium anhuiense]|uniref:response regulator n=1 Tax=Sphingobacterium anhuiense TaxID=493780 RepID=UPI003C2C53B2